MSNRNRSYSVKVGGYFFARGEFSTFEPPSLSLALPPPIPIFPRPFLSRRFVDSRLLQYSKSLTLYEFSLRVSSEWVSSDSAKHEMNREDFIGEKSIREVSVSHDFFEIGDVQLEPISGFETLKEVRRFGKTLPKAERVES